MIFRGIRLLIRLLFWLIARVRVYGIEHLDLYQSYVAAGNHIGRLDPGLVFLVLDRQDIILFVAEKYRKYPPMRWLAKSLNAIWIDRYNADMRAMRQALRRLKQGGVMGIAPEGTRSPLGVLQRGKPGASYLAVKAGVPILPVAIVGCEDRVVIERLKHFRRLDIVARVGKPFKLPDLQAGNRDEQLQEDTDEIMCHIAALLPAERRGYYAGLPRVLELIASEGQEDSGEAVEIQSLWRSPG